jgi:hypothetical protein
MENGCSTGLARTALLVLRVIACAIALPILAGYLLEWSRGTNSSEVFSPGWRFVCETCFGALTALVGMVMVGKSHWCLYIALALLAPTPTLILMRFTVSSQPEADYVTKVSNCMWPFAPGVMAMSLAINYRSIREAL